MVLRTAQRRPEAGLKDPPPVRLRDLQDLRVDGLNPRIHSPRHIKQLSRSMATFGFTAPVLVDADLRVIAGHGRCLAAQALGWTQVPTICLDRLTKAQADAYRIADNKLTENSTWDDALLAAEFERLAKLDLDFTLDVTGFTLPEIEFIVEEGSTRKASAPECDDDLPEVDTGPTVSRAGDLWLLGAHRVLCGNALLEASYRRVMARDRARMVITDPPYNVKIAGHVSGLGRVKHTDFAMACGEMTFDEFVEFLRQAIRLLCSYSTSGSLHYLFMDWRHLHELLAAGADLYTQLMNICTWIKTNGGMGSLYRSQHEFIAVFKHGRAAHRNNVELGRHGRYRTNVWNYAGGNSFGGRQGEEGALLSEHPTVKPVALLADALLDASARGDRVLDPFLGSGSTLLAAERTGRICHGIELEPRFVDCTLRRWMRYTGEIPQLAVTGQTFDAVAAEREEATHG